jgi:Fe-Mn family superoxide dismutase
VETSYEKSRLKGLKKGSPGRVGNLIMGPVSRCRTFNQGLRHNDGRLPGHSAAVYPRMSFAQARKETKMTYTSKDYARLLGMQGFSETLLKNHFTLYQGYVTNTNKLTEAFGQMLKEGKTGSSEFAEMKRRFGWEFNGMRLHEYYFENLGGKGGLEKTSKLSKKITGDFGSYENWEKEFRAVGAMRGVGWAVVYQDSSNGKLFNVWINEHDAGHPAGCIPILILDVFEHAFMIDYGLKRADYIEAFIKNIDWKAVEGRLH